MYDVENCWRSEARIREHQICRRARHKLNTDVRAVLMQIAGKRDQL
jgi:hypothetical protein